MRGELRGRIVERGERLDSWRARDLEAGAWNLELGWLGWMYSTFPRWVKMSRIHGEWMAGGGAYLYHYPTTTAAQPECFLALGRGLSISVVCLEESRQEC
jgi:hypothetical protein